MLEFLSPFMEPIFKTSSRRIAMENLRSKNFTGEALHSLLELVVGVAQELEIQPLIQQMRRRLTPAASAADSADSANAKAVARPRLTGRRLHAQMIQDHFEPRVHLSRWKVGLARQGSRSVSCACVRC